MEMDKSINVFGDPLVPCGQDPNTGFFRDGCCNTGKEDAGSHTVCVSVTGNFLDFSRSRGNDLSTPVAEFNFPGLREGDRWCLCAARWLEAEKMNMAPRLFLQSTHVKALDIVPMQTLRKYALDLL
ncbi:DUF2237 domain-containing protein [Microbulbifer sp. OS29]|uniref:DUF2237 domain-containing protein n=1 Tax=Microbulbifer okhotskensis TaxID=2926617 RepID=A0A9X2J2R4_9GAMM|nr:DUF2237 domain-containing protein [Microbulbifer okhotskensis]MCO1332757.1 DUF2237 domain-containing protein [Microbulbifer okhotskensis]